MHINTMKRNILIFFTLTLFFLPQTCWSAAWSLDIFEKILSTFQPGKQAGPEKTTNDTFNTYNTFDTFGRVVLSAAKKDGLREGETSPHHNPSLTSDEAGNLYLVWENGNELWWAINNGQGWSKSGKIPGEGGSRPVILYDQALGQSYLCPGLCCVWQSFSSPKKIMGSVAIINQGELVWSEPWALTSDAQDDYGQVLVSDPNHQPLLLWLQTGSWPKDDADLYYQSIPLVEDIISRLLSPEFSKISLNSLNTADSLNTASESINISPQQIIPVEPAVPFNEVSTCFEHVWAAGESRLPYFIPIIGGKFSYQIFSAVCEGIGQRAESFPSTYYYNPNAPLVPFVSNTLNLGLSFGDHVNVILSGYGLAEVAVDPEESCLDSQDEALFLGGDFFINYLTLPIPVLPIAPLALARAGIIFQTGADLVLAREPAFPPEQPIGTFLASDFGFGVQGQLTSLGGTLSGNFLGLGGLVSEIRLYPPPSVIVVEPFITFVGLSRVGDDFNGLINTFEFTYVFPELDPNIYSLPSMKESGQDWLIEKKFQLKEGKVAVYEEYHYEKQSSIGTGAQYEGNPVIKDISHDLLMDGLPSLAKGQDGQITAVWTKEGGLPTLGGRVLAADYHNENWTSPVEITPDCAFNQGPAAVFDLKGKLMAVWSSASNEGLDYEKSSVEEILARLEQTDLVYAYRQGGLWSKPQILYRLSGRDDQVTLTSGPKNEIVAAWLNHSNQVTSLYTSFWRGHRWSTPRRISSSVLMEKPALAYAGEKPWLVWSQDSDGQPDTFEDWKLYYTVWSGLAWSRPKSGHFLTNGTNGTNETNETNETTGITGITGRNATTENSGTSNGRLFFPFAAGLKK